MNDPSVSPAPLVAQALQSLRDNAPGATQAPEPDAAPTQASPAPGVPTEPGPAPKAQVKPTAKTRAKPDRGQVKPDVPRGGASAALGALRTVSVSAHARLADAEDFPELPMERELPDLGPYVEHVMREAQAAAAAYREEASRETTARATRLLEEATASAEEVRRHADAYSERALAHADALLAERVRRIAELTGRLSQMAQRAGDERAEDRMMRDQMTRFISSLTAAAEDAVAEVFPNTTSSSPTAPDHARS